MIQVHQVQQGSDAWAKLRHDRYTGTGAHKLLSFSGAVKVVGGVVSSYALNEITGFGGNFYTKRGHLLEDEAIDIYQDITGISVDRPGFVTNDRFPSCGYSPDGLTSDLVVEVKCFNEERQHKIAKNGIPIAILAQIHFGMLISGKKRAVLLLYNPKLPDKEALIILPVKANRNIENNFKRILGSRKATA